MSADRPYTVGLISARGGSKGVPRKNIRPLAGKPLIGWAIEVARNCPSLDRVVVSTDDAEIADVARRFGAEVPFLRPSELARDDSPELLTWQHCIRTLTADDGKAPEVLVAVPATAPLRAVEDVEACVADLYRSGADLCLTVKSAERNPYFTMVTLEDGWARMLIKPPKPIFRRQDAPEVFDIVPVAYAARAEYVLRTPRLLDGKVRATIVPAERSVDIDTELDLAFAEFLLNPQTQPSRK
jgi:N,N'-diacetyl-8-epilegionaminate cytidylyltransferase